MARRRNPRGRDMDPACSAFSRITQTCVGGRRSDTHAHEHVANAIKNLRLYLKTSLAKRKVKVHRVSAGRAYGDALTSRVTHIASPRRSIQAADGSHSPQPRRYVTRLRSDRAGAW